MRISVTQCYEKNVLYARTAAAEIVDIILAFYLY